MARIGTFDRQILPAVWFDVNQTVNGWFVDDLIQVTAVVTNNIRVGTSTPAAYKVGSSTVSKIYIGTNLVYQA